MNERANRLRKTLREFEGPSGDGWVNSLPERKRAELGFHDDHRSEAVLAELEQDASEKEALQGNKKFYATTETSFAFVREWVKRRVPGKIFLDYACGNGAYAIEAARDGAALAVGLDISAVSVENARRAAERAGVGDRCIFIQGDCENTGLPDGSVDVVLCSGMLHHLDLSYAFPELRRILSAGGGGGVILGVEALNYNPLIKLYRRLTPQMRTDWERKHILSLADLRFASRFFDVADVRYWHISAPLAAYAPWAQPLFDAVDSLLTRIPLVQVMSWQFTFELHRREDI